MLRRSTLVLTLVAALCLWVLAAVPNQLDAAAPEHAPTLLVTVAPDADLAGVAALFRVAEVRVLDVLKPLAIYRVAPTGDGRAALSTLRASSIVRAAEPEGEQVVRLVPNDALYGPYQWNLRRIGMEASWDLRPSAPDIVVAVLDTGVDLTHPDLRPNLLVDQGYDFIGDSPLPQDDDSHGTAVAGIIGAIGNNREGIAGIAWRVKLLPIKNLDARGHGPDSAMVKAILYAADAGARIVNISSTGSRSVALQEAVAYAQAKGMLVVAAAGNTGDRENERTYPAAFEGVLAVGAIDQRNQVPAFSQHGPYVGLVAPGVEVPTTSWPGAGRGLYASQSGTSIAAPHVSGVAALLWAMRPDLAAADIAQALRSTADDLGPPGPDEEYGAGVLNASRAIAALRLGVPPRNGDVVARPGPRAAVAPSAVPPPPALPQEGRRWYFAEGSTNPPFEVSFAIENPGSRPAQVRFTFLSPEGAQTAREIRLEARSRATLSANQVVPNAEFGTIVQSDVPVYVERSMYFGHDGHVAAGAREPGRTWYLPEGSSVPPFETWILLMNPDRAAATARLTFMREDGSTTTLTQVVPGFGRRSVYVNALFTAAGFSTQVEADQPIVVERAMYFDGGQGGHDTVAVPAPARTWYLAEGVSRAGFDTWLLVQNPGSQPASASVTFLLDGGRSVKQPLLIAPRSRASLYTNLVVPDATYGITLESDQPVVAERAVYFDGGRAGFDSAAVAAPATEWFLPEGQTSGPFLEQLAVTNPQGQSVNLQVDFLRDEGESSAPLRFSLAAASSTIVDLNPYVPDARVSLRVTSDRPVVVERTLFFANGLGLGATSSAGLTR